MSPADPPPQEAPAPGADERPSYAAPRIAALYAQGLVDYLRARGVDPEALGAAPELCRAADPHNPAETSLAQWIDLLDTATRKLGEPALPAQAGAALQPRHLGALGGVLMSCASLREAYAQLARYIRLLGQIGQPELRSDGSQARLIWRWPYPTPPPQSVAMFMLAARVRFMRWLSDHPELVVQPYFHGPDPGGHAELRQIFGAAPHFEADASELRFAADLLALPVVTADPDYGRLAEQRAQQQLDRLGDDTDALSAEVRQILLRRLATGRVHLDDTAQSLELSPRTLQRRLREQGHSHQGLLDEVRAAAVGPLIADARLPLVEVAFLLGYSDQSTFNAAYRRWFEESPGRARRRVQAQG